MVWPNETLQTNLPYVRGLVHLNLSLLWPRPRQAPFHLCTELLHVGDCHCCPTCFSVITGGRRRSTEIALNVAKRAVGHLTVDTEDCHQCNVLLERLWGC